MAVIVILGAGAWGTALAVTLARGGNRTTLCVRRPAHLNELLNQRENRTYLPGIRLPDELGLTCDWRGAVSGAEVVVMAVPSMYARGAVAPIADAIPPTAIIVNVTKGIEEPSLKTMSQMLAEIAPPENRVAVFAGPGFAAEVARGKPAALVAASRDDAVRSRLQNLFAVRPLRVYSSSDVIGVELGGAAKNVIAIAAGISDGLELGSSARAALITRGIAELMRLVTASGGHGETIAGLAGLGDLVLTCTGDLSRNRSFGLKLARGEPLPPPSDGRPIAEGASNARSINRLAARLGVEMPIVSAVYRILYEGAPANAMVEELLSRKLKAEF